MDIMMERLYTPSISEEEKKQLTLYNNIEFVEAFDQVTIQGQAYYRLPRYFRKVSAAVQDMRTEGENIEINRKPEYSPRDEKQKMAIRSMLDNTHGLVSANVAFGKTYVAVDLITRLKKKTLIVVHKETLMDQWIDRILEYTDLTRDNIGIIKAEKCEFDKAIVLATPQTLIRRIEGTDREFVKNMFKANFGITFFDECHITAAAPAFSLSTLAVFSLRVYGLSATITRSDGLSQLLNWHIGEPIYDDAAFTVKPLVALLDIPIDVGKSKYYIERGTPDGMINRYVTVLAKREDYLAQVSSLIDECIKNGRNILVLSAQIKILDRLYEMSAYPDKIGIIHSQVKNKDYTKQCLLATTGIFKDGMDVGRLDTLVFATPLTSKNSLVQSIGRICRGSENHPLVFDITNTLYPEISSMRKYRIGYYKSFGFKIIDIVSTDQAAKLFDNLTRILGVSMNV